MFVLQKMWRPLITRNGILEKGTTKMSFTSGRGPSSAESLSPSSTTSGINPNIFFSHNKPNLCKSQYWLSQQSRNFYGGSHGKLSQGSGLQQLDNRGSIQFNHHPLLSTLRFLTKQSHGPQYPHFSTWQPHTSFTIRKNIFPNPLSQPNHSSSTYLHQCTNGKFKRTPESSKLCTSAEKEAASDIPPRTSTKEVVSEKFQLAREKIRTTMTNYYQLARDSEPVHYYLKPFLFLGTTVGLGTWYACSQEDLQKIIVFKYIDILQDKAMKNYSYGTAEILGDLRKVEVLNNHEAVRVVSTIVYMNIFIWMCWLGSADLGLQRFMLQNFISIPQSTAVLPHLLAVFSHYSFVHLAMNMMAWYSFGREVCQNVGSQHTLVLLMGGGIFASNVSMWTSRLLTKSKMGQGSLGASGGIMSIIGAAALLDPNKDLSLFMFHGKYWMLIPLTLTFDLLGMVGRLKKIPLPPIDHVAHMGGLVFGILYYHFISYRGRKKESQLRLEAEQIRHFSEDDMQFLRQQAEVEMINLQREGKKPNPYSNQSLTQSAIPPPVNKNIPYRNAEAEIRSQRPSSIENYQFEMIQSIFDRPHQESTKRLLKLEKSFEKFMKKVKVISRDAPIKGKQKEQAE